MKWKSPAGIALCALAAALYLSLIWRPLFWQGLIPVDGNMLTLTFPNWKLMRSVWESPHLPLWNPWRSLGEPHLADPQCMALYPPMLILSAVDDFPAFLRLWVVFHTLLAALALGALARRWYASLPAAAAAGLLAGGNGLFLSRIVFTNHFAAAAWLPAILYFQAVGSTLGLGAALALQWLAGFPSFSLVSLAMCLAAAAAEGRAGLRRLATAGLWALGLCAVQILPFLELLKGSTRSLLLPSEAAMQFSLPPGQLLKEVLLPQWSRWLPDLSGDPAIVSFYIGSAALLMAAWGCVRGGKREAAMALAAAAACLLSLGGHLPGYGALPWLHIFRFPANWLLAAALALSLLAASGVAALRTQRLRWGAAALIAADLLLFAQTPRTAWAKPGFLTDRPELAQGLDRRADGRRIFHTDRVFSLWKNSVLRTEEDYLLMRDFLAPSFGTSFGIPEAVSYQVLKPQLSGDLARRLASSRPPAPLLDYAGVGWVVDLSPGSQAVTRSSLRVLANPSARARVYAADPRTAQVELQGYVPGRVRISVQAAQPATLVLAETDYPGWRAYLDGRAIGHERFEGIFPSVSVPPGPHELRFHFMPTSFLLGLLVSGISAAALFWRRRI
ncbi:MAG: YfhO family protein [Elusimicrobiota bacterium]|jgi:hypothetical protein